MEDTSQSPAAVDADGAQHEFFGENAAETSSPTTKKQASLSRLTFKTSRQIEFCSRKELAAQTGHSESQWPLVILKELMDNAIDAAEEAGIDPEVHITVRDSLVTVADNGPGIPADTVASAATDFDVRVSSREAYVAPTRGAQGNALKTILAIPFALDGQQAETVIEARGIEHRLKFSIDQLRQKPRVDHRQATSLVKNGTQIAVNWPSSACSMLIESRDEFLQIAEDFTWINPHVTVKLDWDSHHHQHSMFCEGACGSDCPLLPLNYSLEFPAYDTDWTKWGPSDPTSAHWYNTDRITRLIAAYIAHDRDLGADRTVREFVSEFRGLSGTAKQKRVLEDAGASRMALSALFADDRADTSTIGRLLSAMKTHSRPVKPVDLGIIGRDHLSFCFDGAGADLQSFQYQRIIGEQAGLPYVVEVAFGWCPDGPDERRIITGVNFSVGLQNPFRAAGGQGLDALLTEQRAGPYEPIILVVHLACPRVEYLDRGKANVSLPWPISQAILTAIKAATKEWCKQRKREEREASARDRRHDRLVAEKRETIKDVAYEVMRDAYLAASTNGTLPARARQIMYAARDAIQSRTGKMLDDVYFTQTLLPNYIDENNITNWNVVFDDRGHFTEPHTGSRIGLGTISVRDYIRGIHRPILTEPSVSPAGITTQGPTARYGAVLFCEKEGFDPLFEHVRLTARYDIALASTKGMSNIAFRTLIDHLSQHHIPCLVLHDLDVAGVKILSTLRRATRRYSFKNEVDVIDIGLRLADVRVSWLGI